MNRIKYFLFFVFCFANHLMFGQNVIVDPQFASSIASSGIVASVNCAERLLNGKILVFYGSNNLVLLNDDGTIDPSFSDGTGVSGGVGAMVECIKETPDGKIIIAGSFTSYNGTSVVGLARLHPDGTLDSSFPGLTFQGMGWVNDVEIDDNGNYLVGGSFFINQNCANFISIQPNGIVNPTFNNNGLSNGGDIFDIEILQNNDIIIAGSFGYYDNLLVNSIVCLNSDGTIDNTYSFGSGANGYVSDITIQPDNKILLVGNFTQINGSVTNRICRLNPDGTIDGTFSSGTGFPGGSSVRLVLAKENGKILVAGYFNSCNNVSRKSLIQLNPDGSVDQTFTTGTGFTISGSWSAAYIYSLIVLPNNQIIAGGNFDVFNGSAPPRITKITVCDPPTSETIVISSCAPYVSPTGQSYVQSGTYNETILSSLGCDSVFLTINLTILNSPLTAFSQTICGGTSFNWNGVEYNQSGQYSQTLVNQSGCDSVVTMDLTVNYITNAFSEQVCYGSSYTWNGQDYSSTGQYSQTLTTAAGCDSIVTLDLFVSEFATVAIPQICLVGLDSLSNLNRVIWEKPLTTGIDSFYVYKETTVSGVYELIGGTDYNDPGLFLDVNSNTAIQAYRYKISARDTCGLETSPSDFHKTIHLTINQGSGNTWNLIWSHYEGISFGSYNIYRGTDPSNITLLATIQSNLNSFTDLNPPAGPVYYQIEVVNPNSCDPNKVVGYNVSKSNIVTNQNNGTVAFTKIELSIHPNPTTGEVTVNVDEHLIGTTYVMKDELGRTVFSGILSSSSEKIDLSSFASGIYFLNVVNSSEVYKIVKR